MKKKFLAVVFCIFAAVMSLCAFAGCSEKVSGGEMGTLALNKKYIYQSYVHDKDGNYSYYIFTSADDGEYHYYDYFAGIYGTTVHFYTIHFRYKIAGEMVHCFFDSVEYDASDTEKDVSSDWMRSFGADTDFLMTTGGNYYLNEDYLNKIPNFGKADANT